MSVEVGDTVLPFVRGIVPEKRTKKTEINLGIGQEYTSVVAEFPTDILTLVVTGNCLKINTSVKSISGQLEDISALVERFKEYNYIHEKDGQSGWALLNSPTVDTHPYYSNIRRYTIPGIFFPASKYFCGMTIQGKMPTNSFDYNAKYGIIPPIESEILSNLEVNTYDSEDGILTRYYSSTPFTLSFTPTATEYASGECKLWDTVTTGDTNQDNWVRVYSPDHVFSGDAILENGLIKISGLNATSSSPAISIWSTEWIDQGTLIESVDGDPILLAGAFAIDSITSDEITVSRIVMTMANTDQLRYKITRGGALKITDRDALISDIYLISTLKGVGLNKGVYQSAAFPDTSTPSKGLMLVLTEGDDAGVLLGCTEGKQSYIDDNSIGWTDISGGVFTIENMPLNSSIYTSSFTNNILTISEGLAEGDYVMGVYCSASNEVVDGLVMTAYDVNGGTDIISDTFDVTSDLAWYELPFTITSEEEMYELQLKVEGNGTTITVDHFAILPWELANGSGLLDRVEQGLTDTRIIRGLIRK